MEINKMEISDLSDAEFKTLVIRMLKELSGYNSIKTIQSKMKDTPIEIKNNIQVINSGVDKAKNQINDLEQKKEKDIQSVQQEEKRIQKIKDSVRSFWDNFKSSNIHILEVPEGEQKGQEIGNLFQKRMKEKFPNLVKEIDIQVQEAQRVLNKKNTKRPTLRHISKMPKVKDKDRILKTAREKQIISYKGVPIRLSADFLE